MRNLEQKYVFAEPLKSMLEDWLAHAMVPDPKYHRGTIASVYFDTPGFDLFYEKRNSDYVKSKLRLRWYDNEAQGDPERAIRCFLEIKRKYGSVRRKDRLEVDVSASILRSGLFTDAVMLNMPTRACEMGYSNASGLMPVAVIRYERLRYVAPDCGARVALDSGIRCLRMNPVLLCGAPPVHLATGVLEVKGGIDTLPASLRPVRHLLRKEAFSKYLRCLERIVDPYGAVA